MTQIKLYISLALALIIAIGAGILYFNWHELNKKVLEQQSTITALEANNATLKANQDSLISVNKQNQITIDSLTADHNKSLAIISQMKNNPTVKFITLSPIAQKGTANDASIAPVLRDALKQAGAFHD